MKPDGTKETTIETVSRKDTDIREERSKTNPSKNWTVFVTATTDTFRVITPKYGVGVTKEILLGINAGVYANTSGEYGLALSYSF